MRGNLKLRFKLNIHDERHFRRRHQARNIMTARALLVIKDSICLTCSLYRRVLRMESLMRGLNFITGVIAIMAALAGVIVMHARAQTPEPPPPPKCSGCQGVVGSTLGF